MHIILLALLASAAVAAPGHWWESLRLQGYTQARISSIIGGDDALVHDADRNIGPDTSFFVRRARIIVLGQVSERMFVYVQSDLAGSVPNSDDTLHFMQMRDAYADLALTRDHDFRLRIGQSKVPYSFEALQSSQNRLTPERNDAVNSAWNQERDLGLELYWARKRERDLFVKLRNAQLRGSGDYGVVGLALVNGQGGNRDEANDGFHVLARVSYPHELANGQIIEGGLAAYSGRFVPRTEDVPTGRVDPGSPDGLRDQRALAHFVLYPQPFGLQAEYNVGRGPELDIASLTIRSEPLHGGYVLASYHIDAGASRLFPYLKYQRFDGAKKLETNAPPSRVREWDLGVEWQPGSDYEVVVNLKTTDRTDPTAFPYPQRSATVLQAHFQFNY